MAGLHNGGNHIVFGQESAGKRYARQGQEEDGGRECHNGITAGPYR